MRKSFVSGNLNKKPKENFVGRETLFNQSFKKSVIELNNNGEKELIYNYDRNIENELFDLGFRQVVEKDINN